MFQSSLTARVGDCELSYRRSGEGSPVVLLHGLGATSLVWHYQIRRLAVRHTVFALDLPALGSVGRLSSELLTELVAGFIRGVAGGPAHLMGHSAGGAVALEVAARHPHLVRSLTLVASAGLGREMPLLLRLLCLPGADRLMHGLGPLIVRAAERWPRLRRRFTGHGEDVLLGPVVTEAFTIYRRRAGVRRFTAALRAGAGFRGQRLQPSLLAAVTAPLLVVWGRFDRVLPLHHADTAVQAAGSRARLAILDCGHSPMLEAAAAFTDLLQDFLAGPALAGGVA